jgi:hypothetical protein
MPTNNFAHAQTLSRMSSSGHMNIARVNIGFFTGFKKIKQRCISFVLGYLRMIWWKISPAISIKHRILATFNIKKKFNSDSLHAFNEVHLREEWSMVKHVLVGYQSVSTSSSPLIPKDIHMARRTHSGKRLRMCEIVCWWRKHKSNRGRTNTLADSIRKRHKKEDSARFV